MRWINIFSLVVALVFNYLAVALPLNGVSPKQVSDRYANQFAPAGLTFSIWSVIYLLLISLMIWQFLGNKLTKDRIVERWGWIFPLNFLLNSLWLFCWHYDFIEISVVVMLLLLTTLVQLNAQTRVSVEEFYAEIPQKNLLKAAFGVYLGWICVATIANVTALLVRWGWNGFGLSATFWTGSMIGTGAVIASWLVVYYQNRFVGMAVIWALGGIALRQWELHTQFTAISWAALTWALAVGTVTIFPRRLMNLKA